MIAVFVGWKEFIINVFINKEHKVSGIKKRMVPSSMGL